MKGHIRQRGKRSFELKFDAGRDPATGQRNIQYASFKRTKREAQTKLAEAVVVPVWVLRPPGSPAVHRRGRVRLSPLPPAGL